MVQEKASKGTTVKYEVTVVTSNSWFAGTDDLVKVRLISYKTGKVSSFVPLLNSTTHRDPFERGQTDQFIVELEPVGVVDAIGFEYGVGNFYLDIWYVSGVSVYDPSLNMYSYKLFDGYNMSMHEVFDFAHRQLFPVPAPDDKIAVCKYPATNFERIWDHTYAYHQSNRGKKKVTYFDAAGGHKGPPPLTCDILVSSATINDAVKVATGYRIDGDHPLKQEYGKDDVTGKETCGLRASGWINWDGQCHQIINRLMHIASPPMSFDSLSGSTKCPQGYGLTRFAFGPYGVGFNNWCDQNGFPKPINYEDQGMYNYIQGFGNAARARVKEIIYFASTLRHAVRNNPAEGPEGKAVKDFIKSLHDTGIDNLTIASMTNLTEREVLHDEL